MIDTETGLPDPERFLASAARFLIEGGENDAAFLLTACRLTLSWDKESYQPQITAHLTGPRAMYDAWNSFDSEFRRAVDNAFGAILPGDILSIYTVVRAEIVESDSDWRVQIAEIAQGKWVHNQGLQINNAPIFTWNNLRFRSEAERRIAIALDQTGVFFLPNCLGRLTTDSGRRNREADFLVCDNGKWGVLEIDGLTYHKAAALDHQRDRVFRSYKIRVVERFPATECQENAPNVVKRFLQQLERNG